MGLFYAGNKVECPVCGSRFRKFLPYGRLKSRPNALCPKCMSLERHRLIWLYLKDRTSFFDQSFDFLHIAPEACYIRRFEKLHGERYITADLESPLAKVKMDIHEMPFEDNSMDAVMCNHVLEHVADDKKAMKEIIRVLKPGGWAILQVPFFYPLPDTTLEDPSVVTPEEREIMYGQNDHLRKYGKDYGNRLASAGFTVKEEPFLEEFDADKKYRFGLPGKEVIYFCTKKTNL